MKADLLKEVDPMKADLWKEVDVYQTDAQELKKDIMEEDL